MYKRGSRSVYDVSCCFYWLKNFKACSQRASNALSFSHAIRLEKRIVPRRIAIVGGGISGLGAAWALHHHPDRFDFRLFEAQDRIGGNAITADMPQDDGSSIPFDISVTACIPSVYHHILLLMKKFGIEPDRDQIQLQREVPRRRLCPRFRLRHPRTTAIRDCQVSASPEASALVRLAEPCPSRSF